MTATLRLAGALLALLLHGASAGAMDLIATVAPAKVSITANYSGRSIVVFGAIAKGEPARHYDAVVTVAGPPQDLIVRRKERVLGVWVNSHSRTFTAVPSFLAVLANRKFDAIAADAALRRHRVGLKHVIFIGDSVDENDPFRANLIKARVDENLYVQRTNAVNFVSPAVFRAEVPLPKSALTGAYDVNMKVFVDGALAAQGSSTFTVEKIGVAQFVVMSSVDHSLIYGLATMIMALATGWIGSIAFRRG